MVFCLCWSFPQLHRWFRCCFIGNIIKECGVTERLAKAAQNEIINIVTIFLGLTVGLKMSSAAFWDAKTHWVFLALGCHRIRHCHCSRSADGKIDESFSKEQNQSAHWLSRCFSSPYGRSCVPPLKARRKIRKTSCSCTRWGPMLLESSAVRWRQDFSSLRSVNYTDLHIIESGFR
jgi:hypothetical protein